MLYEISKYGNFAAEISDNRVRHYKTYSLRARVESIDVISVNVDIVSLCLNNLCQILMLHLMLMFSFRWKEK